MVTIDLIFYYGGNWMREPQLVYSRKLTHTWKGYDVDLLSFIDMVNEYMNKLGYVGVQ